MIDNSWYAKVPELKCWRSNGEIIVEWDGVLLVSPDFYGSNSAIDGA